jgi:20S proteasome subunit alpha 7
MSWIGEETNGEHVQVPKDLFEQAEKAAKEAVELE